MGIFLWSCCRETRARKKAQTDSKERKLRSYFFTQTSLWVLEEGVLRCIATAALRGLGHQWRHGTVRSDKFVEQYGNIIKLWIAWIMRAIFRGDPPWVEF